ncbi:MAG: ABC transporter [Acidobacteria bacterium]|nr:MAG: ABC transporter [Acidobacteriota bacterium]
MADPADESAALRIEGLSKSYRVGHLRPRRKPALHDLSLSVPRGEVFGYLGPNGSGKTTTLKVLMGLAFADAGAAWLLGRPLRDPRCRERVGYLPENPYLYDYLTPAEYLDYVGRLFGMAKAARVSRTRENSPELVFLDEPMSGLDPIGRRMVREIILDLRGKGSTVVFSTHILSDAETLCDRVALLRAGRLVAVGRLDEILQIDVSHMEVLVSRLDPERAAKLPGDPRRRRAMGERWVLQVSESELGALVGAVEEAGGRILSVQPVRQSLEDFFFQEMASTEGASWVAD